MKTLITLAALASFTLPAFSQALCTNPLTQMCRQVSSQICTRGADITETVARQIPIYGPEICGVAGFPPEWKCYSPLQGFQTIYDTITTPAQQVCSMVSETICSPVPECESSVSIMQSCLLNADLQACRSDLIRAKFKPLCQSVMLGLDTALAGSNRQQLPDVVGANGLYPTVATIFNGLMGTPDFDAFVRASVQYYVSTDSNTQEGMAQPRKVYFRTTAPQPDLILHELVHIWQYYRWNSVKFAENYCNQIYDKTSKSSNSGEGGLLPDYSFIARTGSHFTRDYGVEQQASIVQIYYLMKYQGAECSPAGNGSVMSYFKNCSTYPTREAATAALESIISSVGSQGVLLPSRQQNTTPNITPIINHLLE